jgi:mRNA interferase RelE/StbE
MNAGSERCYSIKIKASAFRRLKKLDARTRAKLWAAISSLATDPRPRGCIKLEGNDDLWRIRIGAYRVVYQVRDQELTVLVVRVGHRRDVYRQ